MSMNDNTVSRQSGGAIDEGAALTMNGSGQLVETSGPTDEVYGFATGSTSGADEPITAQVDGRYDLALMDGSSSAISDGDDLMPGSGGTLQLHDGTAGNVFAAMALADCSADGDRKSISIYDGTITA